GSRLGRHLAAQQPPSAAVVQPASSGREQRREMRLGIALDGEGRLGRPAAVTAVARAADRLDYRSVWCLGPWAASLAGAVAAVTVGVRIGLDAGSVDDVVRSAIDPARLVVAELRPWNPARPAVEHATVPDAVQLDVPIDEVAAAGAQLAEAGARGIPEVVVHLVGDPDVDAALAAYALLGELAEGSPSTPAD
ncbi:hypothetical protein B7486_57765, partial [cyanobacterium TDX16]